MEHNKIVFIGVYLLSVFISSLSQIMLKKAAGQKYRSLIGEYLNPFVIIAYGLFFGTTVLSMLALRYIPLSTGAALEAVGYIFVGILSYLILREKMDRKKLSGMSAIIIGVIIFSL